MRDIWALLDEVRAIAQTGLHYCENEFDRERYERLLTITAEEYADRTTLTAAEVRARFEAEIGYATAHVGADAAVFDDEGRILLVHRADDGKWGLVAGWVDPNESPEQTVVRELAEEAGVVAHVEKLVGVFFREARADEHPHSTVSVLYLCTMTGGELRPQLHEVSEVAWKHIDDIAAGDWHHHHEQLARAAKAAR
ncbi:MAG TPA: NUDIX hydrolase N-terminal domain-containing protein [Acidimicrobiia bacterium]|nr:NUDIX hydrolase N-terminal domain-containing protein [Acidimicrobiia bacterium]